MHRLDVILRQGVAKRVFGDARAVVRHRGSVVYAGGTTELAFDIASLTKVVSTTALVCQLGLPPSLKVGEIFPEAGAAEATVADLMYHRSGLPAWDPFFARCHRHDELVAAVLATKLAQPRGSRAVYSDLGFILLGEMLSIRYKKPLDVLFAQGVAAPLGLDRSGFRRISKAPRDKVISTGGTRPREPAPGQEGLWDLPTHASRIGDVDDDNAYVMDGVAGHAGLFATADDVALYGQAILDGAIVSPLGWARDGSVLGSTRAFGFDTPSETSPSCGTRFGPHAVGHLGFTGTSLWIDFERGLVITLLTNRVIFGRANLQIRDFRPAFHDAVLDALDL